MQYTCQKDEMEISLGKMLPFLEIRNILYSPVNNLNIRTEDSLVEGLYACRNTKDSQLQLLQGGAYTVGGGWEKGGFHKEGGNSALYVLYI